jgi:hypothetical protein
VVADAVAFAEGFDLDDDFRHDYGTTRLRDLCVTKS